MLYDQIELGASEEATSHLLETTWPERYAPKGQMVARTPLEWGAHNWLLLIDLEDKKVAAVAVRTDDSYHRLPPGAPPDKIKKGFRPYWEPDAFTEED